LIMVALKGRTSHIGSLATCDTTHTYTHTHTTFINIKNLCAFRHTNAFNPPATNHNGRVHVSVKR